MEDLFRVSFNRLARDIKYQLERANMRNRELNVATIVRADVLTDRLAASAGNRKLGWRKNRCVSAP